MAKCYCLTGCLGCHWHYRGHSSKTCQPMNIFWLFILLLTGSYILFWFYYWLLAENSVDNINWRIYTMLGQWIPAYVIIFSLTCVTLAYLVFLFTLVVCHIFCKIEVEIHLFHVVFVVIILLASIGATLLLNEMWESGWNLIALSIQITGPFLHISGVIFMTFATWVFAELFMRLRPSAITPRIFWLAIYTVLMVALYVSPIFIKSPCICESDNIPPKPLLLAHKGASAIAPENTLIAFEYAADHEVLAFESDVSVSFDGVPFVLHDNSLRRTTNVNQVYPNLSHLNACWFNISQLKRLDAGSWFLKDDPYFTVSSLSSRQKSLYSNQSIPTLSELLETAAKSNVSVMFDIKVKDDDQCPGHPYSSQYEQLVVDVISQVNFTPASMWWLYSRGNGTTGYRYVSPSTSLPISELTNRSIDTVNFEYSALLFSNILEYVRQGIWVNIYTIDSAWLYSLTWCMGINSVTTNKCHSLAAMQQPVWHLTPRQYLIIWIVVDVTSAILIVMIWLVERYRYKSRNQDMDFIGLVDATSNPLM